MATLKFILRHSTRGSSHCGSLCVRIIHSRRVKVLTVPISLHLHEWDEESQQIRLPDHSAERYPYLSKAADRLNNYHQEFKEIAGRLEKAGRYTVDDILHNYRCGHSPGNLYGFADQQARQLLRSGQERTARAYRTVSRGLIRFNKGHDLPLSHINACMMKEFETYLKERGKAMNTISYYMRVLRAIYWKAIREKVAEPKRDNPFENVFTGFQQTRKRALDIESLRALNSLDFSTLLEQQALPPVNTGKQPKAAPQEDKAVDSGLYTSWRYFFFCFHARGMSFVDMAYLRKENIRQGVISYYRKKTGQKIEVTLTPSLQRLIDSFSGEVRHSPYLFPIIRDAGRPARLQYENGLRLQNKRLKKLSALAGIGEKLSTHVSRHSWATTGKKQNLPLWVISEGLGHSSEKMTYTYLASFDRSTLDRANEQIALALLAPPAVTVDFAPL
ncbi:site-specific integrase [Dysgonomonas sp. GY75]|uniref:site-specific integrase n=1 Tax=Dysgonomonas sp. GY75 TaxID=2780419 RepID=UPI001883E4A2|nr:site-specific integrase [Dysgonomonas sp. GY75]MBF0647868.1 site-specific integrase [Dysgonomonas sp. GY75]